MRIEHLGQSGFLINHQNQYILIDPYLSNSVEILDSKDLVRKIPIPYKPENLKNISWILLTHEHIDHCDPHTIPVLAKGNPNAKFIGPEPVRNILKKWKINPSNIIKLSDGEINLGDNLKIFPVPSSHPKLLLSNDGYPITVGWVIDNNKTRVYIAGDTNICEQLINFLKKVPQIDIAILPVNEDNFFRRRRGIIGNMSIREAFGLTDELNIKQLFPVHWDMFEINSALPEEIDIIYNSYQWKFKLIKNISRLRF